MTFLKDIDVSKDLAIAIAELYSFVNEQNRVKEAEAVDE
jgi:hypothetical protein